VNNNIFPCLWYNGDAKQCADFYCYVFSGKITVDSPMVINLELFGQRMMLLNGGPAFQKNASVSFTLVVENENDIDRYWELLSESGDVILSLDEYPWSKKYGWVRDKFGVTRQLFLGSKRTDQAIIPTLMFLDNNNGKAMQAMKFYTSIFPHSQIEKVLKFGDGVGNENHEIPENVQHAHFVLDGYDFFCMDNSHNHPFNFTEAISVVIMTDDQEQTDYYWNSLTADGGKEGRCGWLKDQFGMSWQIVPKRLLELMNDFDNPEKARKTVEAMLHMTKIEIKELETAYHS